MKMFSDTSTAATLRSRYDVAWDEPLGEGAFGAVYLCRDRQSGRKYAMKKSFTREIDALMYIRETGGHPGICRLIENFDEGPNFYLVLDLIQGGELFDQLARSGPYSEADAARLVREVASALAYLHGVGIVHADLKPEVSTLFDTHSILPLFPLIFQLIAS
jgi:serine/threonine protein kinase